MPMQFNKIPSCKTITEIKFRYRCYQFKIMTSKKCRQGRLPKRAPKRTQQMCPNSKGNTGHTMKRRATQQLIFTKEIKWFEILAGYCAMTSKISCKGRHPNAHQNGHKKCVRIRLRVMLDFNVI